MWPWGHLAAGYLLYVLGRRLAGRVAVPRDGVALALAVGTQLPDLIDKPFAWTVPLLPNGRSLGHSLLIGPPLLVALLVLVDGRRRDVVAALTTGYLTHVGTDALYPLVSGEWYYLGFVGWPVIPPVDYGTGQSLLAHFLAFELTPRSGFEFLLVGVAATVWYSQGMPGLRLPVDTVRRAALRVRRLTR